MSDNGHGQTLHEYANYPSTERLQNPIKKSLKKKGKFDITNTHIHDHSFSWLGTSTSYGHCVVIYGFWLPLQTLLSTKSVKNQTKETGRSHFTMATYKYIRGQNYPSSVHQCNILVYWPGLYTIHSWTTKQNVIQIKSSTS